MIVKKFVKKPVEIEAIQFFYVPSCIDKIKEFCGVNAGVFHKERHPTAKGEFEIVTLEDGEIIRAKHIATEGDWIIKGVQGEFYACNPDIFAMTYEDSMMTEHHNVDANELIGCIQHDCSACQNDGWISVSDGLPDYIEGNDYSENVLGMYQVGECSHMGIFNIFIVGHTANGHTFAWAKLNTCWDDLRDSEPEYDDDYEVTHWMPLPAPPKAMSEKG